MVNNLSLGELKTLMRTAVHEAMREREMALAITLARMKQEREYEDNAEDMCNSINYGKPLPIV